jgi:hypothetical protein
MPGRPTCNRASVIFGPYVVQSNEACLEIFGVEAFNVEVLPNKNPVLVGESPSIIIKMLNPGQVPLVVKDLAVELPPSLQFEAGVAPNGQMFPPQTSPRAEGWALTGYRGDIVIPPGRSVIYEVRAKAVAPGVSKIRIEVVVPRVHPDNRPYKQEQSITIYNPDDAVQLRQFGQAPVGRPSPGTPSMGPIGPTPSFTLKLDAPVEAKPASTPSDQPKTAAPPLKELPKAKNVAPAPPPLEFPDLPLK